MNDPERYVSYSQLHTMEETYSFKQENDKTEQDRMDV